MKKPKNIGFKIEESTKEYFLFNRLGFLRKVAFEIVNIKVNKIIKITLEKKNINFQSTVRSTRIFVDYNKNKPKSERISIRRIDKIGLEWLAIKIKE